MPGSEQGQQRKSTRACRPSRKAAEASAQSLEQELTAIFSHAARNERWDKLKAAGVSPKEVVLAMDTDRLTAAVIGSDMKRTGQEHVHLWEAPSLDDVSVAYAEAAERSLPTILRHVSRIKEMAHKKQDEKTPAPTVRPAPTRSGALPQLKPDPDPDRI